MASAAVVLDHHAAREGTRIALRLWQRICRREADVELREQFEARERRIHPAAKSEELAGAPQSGA
jgi:hypothetical protein